ncbi:MAG: HD domain-containing protein, partial [Armatimonadetes bacterium]|nr:HD domain-containing protein [Armatimonadota bacterium]
VAIRQRVASAVVNIGSSWQVRSLGITFLFVASFLASVALETGGAGLVYHWLSGEALIASGRNTEQGWHFLLPFLGLVGAAGCINAAIYAFATAAIDPIPGATGVYGTILRARLALVETAWPIVRGQLFLSVVAFLLAYLYSQIGIIGFFLAITPVLALRDFFHQWVEEKEAYFNTITTLATYMQHYHPYTRGHLQRVADLSERLARELRLPIESIRHMKVAGLLHDIGKVGVSEEILDKPGKLNDEEWKKIKEHPIKGAEIVSHLEFLEGIVDWIKYHHKWYNGSGYPTSNGNGSEPPIEAAIIATADAFDAMTDDREMAPEWRCDSCGFKVEGKERPMFCPKCGAEKRRRYRLPKTIDEAIEEIRRGTGTQFHPKVVKAFLKMIEREGIKPDA